MSESITRRLFLRKAAAAGPAAMLPGATIAASAGIPAPEENPELLALGRRLTRAERVAAEAARRLRQATTAYGQMFPTPPDELLVGRGGLLIGGTAYSLSEECHDHNGGKVLDADGLQIRVYRSYHLERALAGLDGRTRRAKFYRRLYPLAKAFEAEQERVFHASGLEREMRREFWAMRVLSDIAEAIQKAEAMTMQGLITKARAVLAVHGTGDRWAFNVTQSGPLLAAAIMAMAGTAQSEPIEPPYDYEGAIAAIERLGVPLAAVIGKDGSSEGFRSGARKRRQQEAVCNILYARKGFSPYRLGEVLAAQGKLDLPAQIGGAT